MRGLSLKTRFLKWSGTSLQRQFAVITGALLLLASCLFLVLVVQHSRIRVQQMHEDASVNVNLLLQAALENAMIKRDIDGLQQIIARLGTQEGIAGVMIANPAGEVRFASYLDKLYTPVADPLFEAALNAGEGRQAKRELEDGTRVLRSVNPVPNQAPCQECHGQIESHPINGLLIVDYDYQAADQMIWRGALLLTGLGLVVLLLLEGGIWLALRRLVLDRIWPLSRAAKVIAAGDLSVRTRTKGQDELARLGDHFDIMADQLDETLDDLRAAHATLQDLIDAIPDGVRVIGADYRIIMANRAYCDQIGVAPEQAIGAYCYSSSHGRTRPCVPTLVQCPVARLLENGQTGFTCQHEHQTAEGAEFSVEVSAAAVSLRIDGRETPCVVESIRDMESDISISHKQRLAEMGSLAAGIAHEVHNPLSSIALALGAIKSQVAFSDETAKYFALAETEIQSCKETTERLLRLSALPHGAKEQVELAELVADTASLLGFEAQQRGVKIDVEIQGLPTVHAQDSDIRNLLFNLALNAIHAMPDGGTLTLQACTQGDMAVIVVADTGVGIPERERAKVLMPFWTRRADGSKGRGLGLAICSSIVRNLGGDLSFTSEPGVGTRFKVILPKLEHREP